MSSERNNLAAIMNCAGELVRSLEPSDIAEKSKLDYVTNMDHRLDEFLTRELTALTPGIPVLSEERPFDKVGADFWIIDPIDGTHNMMTGVPFFAVCAALFDDHGAKLAAVLDIAAAGLYLAERGHGATLNDKALRLPEQPSTLIALSSGVLDRMNAYPDIYNSIRETGKLRNLGSQSLHLAFVADGRFGLAVSEEARFWDDAAARLIAEEAGARYRSFATDGEDRFLSIALSQAPLKSLCAHPALFDEVEIFLSLLWSENKIHLS